VGTVFIYRNDVVIGTRCFVKNVPRYWF